MVKRRRNGKRNGNGNGRSNGGRNFTLPYKDTIYVTRSLTAGSTTTFTFTGQDLFPGLQSSGNDLRNVVLTRVIFELLPIVQQGALVMAQAQVGSGLIDATSTGMAPFKLASAVNPTRYIIDFRRFAKVAPKALAVRSAASLSTGSLAAFKVVSVGPDATVVMFRATSFCSIFPQEDPILVVPTIFVNTAEAQTQQAIEQNIGTESHPMDISSDHELDDDL